MRGLLEAVGDGDQLGLTPLAREEAHADRQAMDKPRGHGDVGIASHSGR